MVLGHFGLTLASKKLAPRLKLGGAMRSLPAVLALLFAAPIQAAGASRLYHPQSATAKARYALYLSRQPAGISGALGLKVRVRSASKAGGGELLLTIHAKSADRKSASAKQARFALAKGQREQTLGFDIEGPACARMDIVAALFEAGEPLARATARHPIPCDGAR